MALLNATDGFATNEDGNITLTQEQMKSIDDRLQELEEKDKTNAKAVSEASKAVKELKDQLAKAQNESKDKDAQIAALKGSAGTTTDDNPANSEESFTAQDVFNLIKDV